MWPLSVEILRAFLLSLQTFEGTFTSSYNRFFKGYILLKEYMVHMVILKLLK